MWLARQGQTLTSELQATQLEGGEAVADFNEVHQGVEVVGGQHEAVSGAIVAPAAQHQVPAQCVLQRPRKVLVENGVEVVVVRTCPGTDRQMGGLSTTERLWSLAWPPTVPPGLPSTYPGSGLAEWPGVCWNDPHV